MYNCPLPPIGSDSMLTSKSVVLAAVAVFALGSVPTLAQTTTTGSIEGTVTDTTVAAQSSTTGHITGTVRDPQSALAGAPACPLGVVVKKNDCLPPGQAKQQFIVGQRVPTGYRFYTPLANIPMALRKQIPSTYLTGDYKYIYRDGIIYLVNSSSSKTRGGAVAGVLYASFHNND